MRKRFVFAREEQPGEAWLARFKAGRERGRALVPGRAGPRRIAAECRAALRDHMPELLPHYDHVCGLVGDDDVAHCILSHYRPPPVIAGCSQAVWTGSDGPVLIRNYDFPLDVVSDRFEATAWSGREVIAKAQRPWGGCLDGMNADGLVASMTFGGSPAQGRGFSIILMLRYVLETCRRVDEAVAALTRIPVAMSHNVTLLDRSGAHATLYLGPGRAPGVTARAALHQSPGAGRLARARGATAGRSNAARRLRPLLAEPGLTLERLIEGFLAPPLYSRRSAFPTVYTAVYRPAEGRVDYLWPGRTWSQRIGGFEAGEYVHDYGEIE